MQQETEWPVFSAEDMGLFEDAMEDFDRQQIGSVLQARKNLFLNTAAYQFSSTFFRLRGLDNSNQSVYINGILMNEPASGTARWQQWGGINDFINASQKFTYGNAALDSGWGGFQSTKSGCVGFAPIGSLPLFFLLGVPTRDSLNKAPAPSSHQN